MNDKQLAVLTDGERLILISLDPHDGPCAGHCSACGAPPKESTRELLTALADARLETAEREKAVASLRQSLTVMQPLYEAQKDTVATLEAEVARLTEELEDYARRLAATATSWAHVAKERDRQREDIRRLLEAAAVIELEFIPYGSCDSPGHNSPDSCWWSTLFAELKERYDA